MIMIIMIKIMIIKKQYNFMPRGMGKSKCNILLTDIKFIFLAKLLFVNSLF